MIKMRKSAERGLAKLPWLTAQHTFSFASYYDPEHMHFGPLRVINQDRIAAYGGFPEHPHYNMEIITYIIKGELSHKDNSGGESTIYPGRLQRMSAGTGIAHSEFNNSDSETELLQMWLVPDKKGHQPGYEEKNFAEEAATNQLQLLVSGARNGKTLAINRDISLYRSFLNPPNSINYKVEKKYQWLQLITGTLNANDHHLHAGDAMGLTEVADIFIRAEEKAHFLLFDMN